MYIICKNVYGYMCIAVYMCIWFGCGVDTYGYIYYMLRHDGFFLPLIRNPTRAFCRASRARIYRHPAREFLLKFNVAFQRNHFGHRLHENVISRIIIILFFYFFFTILVFFFFFYHQYFEFHLFCIWFIPTNILYVIVFIKWLTV